jgi:hypothetical protein
MDLHAQLGNQWAQIAKGIPGRTADHVKTRHQSIIRKRKKEAKKQLKQQMNKATHRTKHGPPEVVMNNKPFYSDPVVGNIFPSSVEIPSSSKPLYAGSSPSTPQQREQTHIQTQTQAQDVSPSLGDVLGRISDMSITDLRMSDIDREPEHQGTILNAVDSMQSLTRESSGSVNSFVGALDYPEEPSDIGLDYSAQEPSQTSLMPLPSSSSASLSPPPSASTAAMSFVDELLQNAGLYEYLPAANTGGGQLIKQESASVNEGGKLSSLLSDGRFCFTFC